MPQTKPAYVKENRLTLCPPNLARNKLLVVSVALSGFLVLLCVVLIDWRLDIRPDYAYNSLRLLNDCYPDESDPSVSGFGVMYFAYSNHRRSGELYLRQAVTSAQRLKSLNPTISITLYTNWKSSQTEETLKLFDHILEAAPKDIIGGKQDRGDGISRQWLTRITAMGYSPYQLTLAVDSHVTFCTTSLVEILALELKRDAFDIAYNYGGSEGNEHPHNFAILYKSNDRLKGLLKEWKRVHEQDSTGSDQQSLKVAMRQQANLPCPIRQAKLADNFAASFFSEAEVFPKFTRLLYSEV